MYQNYILYIFGSRISSKIYRFVVPDLNLIRRRGKVEKKTYSPKTA